MQFNIRLLLNIKDPEYQKAFSQMIRKSTRKVKSLSWLTGYMHLQGLRLPDLAFLFRTHQKKGWKLNPICFPALPRDFGHILGNFSHLALKELGHPFILNMISFMWFNKKNRKQENLWWVLSLFRVNTSTVFSYDQLSYHFLAEIFNWGDSLLTGGFGGTVRSMFLIHREWKISWEFRDKLLFIPIECHFTCIGKFSETVKTFDIEMLRTGILLCIQWSM